MITVNPDLEADTVVDNFRQCVLRGDAVDRNAPDLLIRILRDGYWRRPDKRGKPFTHLEAFIVAKPLAGIGSDVQTIKRIIAHDPKALDAFDRALKQTERRGRPNKIVNNVDDLTERPRGNSRQAAIRILRTKRPDLHAQVITGELTPHRAMVQGGLRDETLSIPADPVKAAARLRKRFTGEALVILLRELTKKDQ